MLSIAYKLNCTLQSEMHDGTVRSHAHSSGEYASEVERTAPCYSSERGDLDRRFEMSHDIVSDTPKDRKSTRLNSSHQIISYAVFCLQKNSSAQDAQHLGHAGGLLAVDVGQRV